MDTNIKNLVLEKMKHCVLANKSKIIEANLKDITKYDGIDTAIAERLVVDDKKIQEMVHALDMLVEYNNPVGRVIYSHNAENGLKIENKTAPFGTILIIYESRPDVTVEAAGIAFKAGNAIILKGGKESYHTNIAIIDCWHEALIFCGLPIDLVKYLSLNREETQSYLKNPLDKIDLIVPRGGEALIEFVKTHATCPVLVSGRGNNFIYVDEDADWDMAVTIIINAKTSKVSACNALDKVLLHKSWLGRIDELEKMESLLKSHHTTIISNLSELQSANTFVDENIWYEEFLAMKIMIDAVENLDNAISKINTYSGGHSACIVTQSSSKAHAFMDKIDCAAVYHNASTRFTDGGQMGLGAELAISTDKLHHRGPLGLDQLVTNKWYIHGNGQIR
jgi:glutamate-5-semialdehyde dehydrogenase